jgi:hypothetical protein
VIGLRVRREMSGLRVVLLAMALALGAAAPGGAQTSGAPMGGEPMHMPPQPAPSPFHIVLSATTLAGLPRVTISATDEGGRTDTYTGVSLHDLIVRAGAPSGAPLRGKAMTSAIVIGASDGYHVIFALPEIDPSYTDHVVVIADTRDGTPIGPDAGPYRLVVPFEKRQARWVKNATDINLVNVNVTP